MDNIWVIFIVMMLLAGLVSLSAWLGIRIDNLKHELRMMRQSRDHWKEQIETYQKALFGGERRGGE